MAGRHAHPLYPDRQESPTTTILWRSIVEASTGRRCTQLLRLVGHSTAVLGWRGPGGLGLRRHLPSYTTNVCTPHAAAAGCSAV